MAVFEIVMIVVGLVLLASLTAYYVSGRIAGRRRARLAERLRYSRMQADMAIERQLQATIQQMFDTVRRPQ